MNSVAKIIGGCFDELIARQKTGSEIEIGEILVSDEGNSKTILQVFDILYGSQIGPSSLELISGMSLEGKGESLGLIEPELANYNIIKLKPLVSISNGNVMSTKKIPGFLSDLRRIEENDIKFMKSNESLFIGKIRTGSKVIDIEAKLNAKEILNHHILISSATGKGKSNLCKVMCWSLLDEECSLLILDPHDEYYGRNGLGLKDHAKNVDYYSLNAEIPGARKLVINIEKIKPGHFKGAVSFTEAQMQAMYLYYNKYGSNWIKEILTGEKEKEVHEETFSVLKRKFSVVLGIKEKNNELVCKGLFSDSSGKTTLKDIADSLENSRTVIIDTSMLSNELELLIGSMAASAIFGRYKKYRSEGKEKPPVSIVIEEAPRVIGRNVLQEGRNIFSTIAREGRKFNLGLIALTQLPSLIPKEILANINTKIILGMELNSERKSIIESASQDLSKDEKTIASLDKGEAIISSVFTKFAVPVKIPLFHEYAKKNSEKTKKFEGMV